MDPIWTGSKSLFKPIPKQASVFMYLQFKSLLKTLREKGEIARNKQFPLFLQCFSSPLTNFLPFSSNLKLSSV